MKKIITSVALAIAFVAGVSLSPASAAPPQPSGTLAVTNVPTYGGTVEFATETWNVKRTYDTYVSLVCVEGAGLPGFYVQYSVGVSNSGPDTASIPLRDFYNGPGGFNWHWYGERAECSAGLIARSPVARGKDGYDMPTLDQIQFVIEDTRVP